MALTTTAQDFMETVIAKSRELGVQPCDLMSEMVKIAPKRRGRPPKESKSEEPTKRRYESSRPDMDPSEMELGTTSVDHKGRTWIVVTQKAFSGTKKNWKLVKQEKPAKESNSLEVPAVPPHHVPTGDELRAAARKERHVVATESTNPTNATTPTNKDGSAKRAYTTIKPTHAPDSVEIGVPAIDSIGRTWISSDVKAFKGTKRIWKLVKPKLINVSEHVFLGEVAPAKKNPIKIRTGPSRSAKEADLGEIDTGNDGNQYIVVERTRVHKVTGNPMVFHVWQRIR